MGEAIAFYVIAAFILGFAVLVVSTKDTVHSVLFLVLDFLFVAALAFLDFVPGWIWFGVKSFVFLYIFIWVRATLPRYRYDQLMRLGWKVLIPLAIANLVVTGIVKVVMLSN